MPELPTERPESQASPTTTLALAPEHRYETRGVIGRGGMGDVQALFDHHLGRTVARKVLRTENAAAEDMVQRFVREARIQGQLEHPSVVPVYDLTITDNLPCFTMKRVRGTTLYAVLERQRSGDREALESFSMRRLLTAFSRLCLAVAYVHERGVVHRDLKPGNLMLGEYGEVYLLDWGVAKVIGAPDPEAAEALGAEPGLTDPGQLFGTPGYASPEQVRAEPVDERSDVFSLGAILFELLTLKPLIDAEHPSARINATTAGVDVYEAAKGGRQQVPAALLSICAGATATRIEQRTPNARVLHDEIEAFLDRLLDLERRREQAKTHALAATTAVDRVLDRGEETERQDALRKIGRALALDPASQTASHALWRLFAAPPTTIPDEVKRDLDKAAFETAGHVRLGTIGALAGALLAIPLILGMGVIEWPLFWCLVALNFGCIAAGLASAKVRREGKGTDLVFSVSMIWAAGLSMMFGPFILVPSIASIVATAYLLIRRRRRVLPVIAIGALAFLIPWGLQVAGVLPSSYAFEGGAMIVQPWMHRLPEAATTGFLLLSSLFIVALPTLIVSRLRSSLINAERAVRVQAWQLARLVPAEAQVDPSTALAARDSAVRPS